MREILQLECSGVIAPGIAKKFLRMQVDTSRGVPQSHGKRRSALIAMHIKNNTRLLRAQKNVQRRVFLKAMGLGLSLPVAVQLGRYATAQGTGPLKRMLVVFLPHGIPGEHYSPRVDASGDFTLNDSNLSILGPLEPYKKLVNVYEGLYYPGEAQTHSGVVNFLSGIEEVDVTTPRTTVEHVIGNALGTKPLILGACAHPAYGIDDNSKLFWNETFIEPEKDPSVVADRLFAGLGDDAATAEPGAVNPELKLRSELMGLTRAEVAELKSEVKGLTREETKLQTHLDAVASLQQAADKAADPNQVSTVSCTSKPSLPTVEKVRAASAGQVIDSSGGNDYFYQESNFPLLYEAQLELATQALICGAAPIIGVQGMYTTCDFDFGFAGASGSHHNTLSHTQGSAASGAQWDSPISLENYSPDARVGFAKAQLWFSNMLVDKVVSVLAATDDPSAPGSSVLDNTLIYWMSEIGDGANHERGSVVMYPQFPAHLPLVTIGGAAGGLKTGQVVSFPIGEKMDPPIGRPASDLYLTLAHAMGASNVSFPGTTGVIGEALA